MPWSETCPMDERARFVLDALEGWTSMSELCAQYGISRRVGYKWLERYREGGLGNLSDQSRARHGQNAQTDPVLIKQILAVRKKHPTWGPRKLRAWLDRAQPTVCWPACSTIGALLRREGLSTPRRRRPRAAQAWSPARTEADRPNRVWTTDFKGEFELRSGRLCYPLTIVDGHSRYLIECRALPGTTTAGARATFERVFREYGLPEVIRTDNGVPFSVPTAVGGLSQLAVWWIRLGIRLERTRKRHPEDNGAHERMHRTLKAEATRPPRSTPELQQRAFNRFRRIYNEERPHEAIGLQPPRSLYHRSDTELPTVLPLISYPDRFEHRRVNRHGQIRWRGLDYFVSETLLGQDLGLELMEDGTWSVYFGPALLAVLDDSQRVLRRLEVDRRRHRW